MNVSKATFLTAVLLALLTVPAAAQENRMSYFITSVGSGDGANLGGLDGADRHCAMLADAVGVTGGTWRAYLSLPADEGRPAVNARDRIGTGPWFNAAGTLIASNVADLHGDNAKWTKETALNEKGEVVNGRGDSPNMHDIMTGSQLDGTAFPAGDDTTCNGYTSGADGQGSVRVGHHDKNGGGENPNSWNSAHASRGCSQANLVGTGGNGFFYCFAVS
jgi:hypothetical protein